MLKTREVIGKNVSNYSQNWSNSNPYSQTNIFHAAWRYVNETLYQFFLNNALGQYKFSSKFAEK